MVKWQSVLTLVCVDECLHLAVGLGEQLLVGDWAAVEQPHAAQRRLGARELAEAERGHTLPAQHRPASAQQRADHGVGRAR